MSTLTGARMMIMAYVSELCARCEIACDFGVCDVFSL